MKRSLTMSMATTISWRNINWLISMVVSLLFLLCWPGISTAASEAVVDASVLNIRSGPGPQYGISGRVEEGTRLPVLDKQGDWYKVSLAGGQTGWVAGWLVDIKETSAEASASQQVVVTTDILNVREGPGTGNAIVGALHNGDKLPVLDSSGDWYKVRMPGGSTGWIASWLIDVNNVSTTGGQQGQSQQSQQSQNQQGPSGNSTGKEVVVKTGILNVRGGPGTSNGIVARVNQGVKLPLLESSNDWCKVKLPDGGTGWVAGWLVDIHEVTAPPVEQADQSTGNVSKEAVVKTDTLNVRGGPGTSNGVVARVEAGDRMPILESSNGWCKVELPGGGTGWVAGWLVDVKAVSKPQETPVTGEAVVYAGGVNVRGGPGTDHNVVTQVSRGERMSILDKAGEWYKVKSSGGTVGWIAGWLVQIDTASASTPEDEKPEQDLDENKPGESGETGADSGQEPGGETEAGDSEMESSPDTGEESGEEEPSDSQLKKLSIREVEDRMVIDIAAAAPMEHNIFTLTNPNRVVVDLIGITPGDVPEELDVSSELVSRLRTGWFDKNPNTVRLVFDVNDSVMFSAQSSNGDKELTLEMYVPRLGDFLRNRVIAIDPGHGGSEPGSHGPSGIPEKEINLDVGILTAHLLEQNGARVVLTRSTDRYVGLEERTDIARKAGAEIFVSIHMNGNPISSKSGTSTYYRRDDVNGLGVSQADNRLLARHIQSQLVSSLGRLDLGVKQANFVVLRTAAMPAVLAEVSFLTNPQEEQLLMKDSYRAQAAEAITKGIANYFAEKAK